jgi:hypothetical protein
MRAVGIVADAVLLSKDLGFEKMVEDLAIQQILAERPIEAFQLSTYPFSHGVPDSMKQVSTPKVDGCYCTA